VNLHLYLRVLRRFWLIVAIGFVLAVALAFASLVKVSYTHGSLSYSYRQQPTWQSTTRLFVTQVGFPWGRSVLPTSSPTPALTTGNAAPSGLEFADPTRLEGLAVLYAQLINGDPIQSRIREIVPQHDALGAEAVTDPLTNSLLPLVDVIGLAHTRADAARLSQRGADLFRSYIAGQQSSAGIPLNQRVLLQVISTKTKLIAGRKKTLAIVAFVAVMIATVGFAFVLENLRPRLYAFEPTTPERVVVTEHTI
jgi:hypothetical protein